MKQVYEIPEKAHLIIRANADVRFRPAEDARLLIYSEGPVEWALEDRIARVTLPTDARLLLPEHIAHLTLEHIRGDASLRCPPGMSVTLTAVYGDLRLHGAGSVQAGALYGDARFQEIHGEVQIEQVTGDLTLRRIAGAATARCLGDLKATLAGQAPIRLQAAGDLLLRLPPQADVSITAQAGEETRVQWTEPIPWEEGHPIVFGSGSVPVHLKAGGGIWIVSQDTQPEKAFRFDAAAASSIVESLTEPIEQISERVAAWAEAFADRIAESVPRKMAMSFEALSPKPAAASSPPGKQTRTSRPDSTPDERLYILQMLESGKISLEAAQTLLDALEGDA